MLIKKLNETKTTSFSHYILIEIAVFCNDLLKNFNEYRKRRVK